MPGVAQPAMQMGTHAAQMIQSDLEGRPRKPFHYFDKGDMATIGRNRAIADVKWPFKAHLGGWPAWLTWGLVHIYFLIGFRNRIAVMFQWAWTYLTLGHGARLITGNQKLPGWDEQVAAHKPVTEKPLDLASPHNRRLSSRRVQRIETSAAKVAGGAKVDGLERLNTLSRVAAVFRISSCRDLF